MKKTLYLCLVALASMMSKRAHAQHVIVTHSINNYADSACLPVSFTTTTNGWVTGQKIEVSYGDGAVELYATSGSSTAGYVNFIHPYSFGGTYTVKQVLIEGGSRIDSVSESYDYGYCQNLYLKYYYDANGNCTFDSGIDNYLSVPLNVEIDSDGHPIDTVTVIGSLYYQVYGPAGAVYTFHPLSIPSGITATCPTTGDASYTVSTLVGAYVTQYVGFSCSTVSLLDVGEFIVSGGPGRHMMDWDINVFNMYCNPTDATLTMTFSPKYNFTSANITPASVSGNVITWHIPALTIASEQFIHAHFDVPSTWLTPGDTVHNSFVVTPTTGDVDLSNNTIIRVDTVKASYDPNEKSVTPEGYIHAGTNLRYDIQFENTGNDTAFNIHIMDTLSDNVDARSLKLLGSSTPNMSLSVEPWGGHNVVKFDFPHINLLDSSHHGNCTGFVSYSVNARSGLANGTVIDNRAGIYFDDNEVVMTNTTTNMIGIPARVNVMTNNARVNVYPNPANSELNIQADGGNFTKVTITNMLGQTVASQPFLTGLNTINVKRFAPGLYYIVLTGVDGSTTVRKFEKM